MTTHSLHGIPLLAALDRIPVSFSVFNGAVAGLGLGLARAAAQHLEQSVRVALAFDRRVLERLE